MRMPEVSMKSYLGIPEGERCWKPADRLGNPPADWDEERKAIWDELRFAIPRDILIEQYRMGYAHLVHEVYDYRCGLTSHETMARQWLHSFRVPSRLRGRVLQGGGPKLPAEGASRPLVPFHALKRDLKSGSGESGPE